MRIAVTTLAILACVHAGSFGQRAQLLVRLLAACPDEVAACDFPYEMPDNPWASVQSGIECMKSKYDAQEVSEGCMTEIEAMKSEAAEVLAAGVAEVASACSAEAETCGLDTSLTGADARKALLCVKKAAIEGGGDDDDDDEDFDFDEATECGRALESMRRGQVRAVKGKVRKAKARNTFRGIGQSLGQKFGRVSGAAVSTTRGVGGSVTTVNTPFASATRVDGAFGGSVAVASSGASMFGRAAKKATACGPNGCAQKKTACGRNGCVQQKTACGPNGCAKKTTVGR